MEDKYHIQKASIIVPCFNQAEFLDDCLQSVFNQTYIDWECIIVNDGSKDNTEFVSKKWELKDARFKYFSQKNQGVSAARNYGIEKSIGEFILPLDGDDIIGEDYVRLALDAFKLNSNLKLVYSKAKKFGDVNEDWNLPKYDFKLLLKGNIIFNCAMYKRQDWECIGGYDINFDKGYEDWDFWINLLKDGGEVYQIPKICFLYRINNSSRNHTLTNSDIESIRKHVNLKYIDVYIKTFGSYSDMLIKVDKLIKVNKTLKNDWLIRLKEKVIKKIKHVF